MGNVIRAASQKAMSAQIMHVMTLFACRGSHWALHADYALGLPIGLRAGLHIGLHASLYTQVCT